MTDIFQDLGKAQDLFKARLYFLSAFFCSFIFWFFMTRIDNTYIDFFAGRVLVAIIALGGFIITFILPKNLPAIRIFLYSITIGYLGLYLYLLHINDWSVFHRWSYFVVASILCSSALTFRDYIFNTVVGLLAPLLLIGSTNLTPLELIHFHSANVVTILLIGYSVRLHFFYKKEAALLTQNLIEQSKLVVLGEIAAGVSHEVNNPLTVLSTSGEQLKKLVINEQYDQKKLLDLIDKINRMTLRISKIVNGLRDFSRDTEEEAKVIINLNETLKNIVASYQSKFIAQGITSELYLCSEDLKIMGQKNHITDAILKILDNASEACKNEGIPTIKINLIANEQFAKITICDNGPGVPEELASKIMHPFFTTKSVGGGPGLGLSIALGIAQRHGGKLYVDKEVSSSCFSLLLPLL